MNPKLKILKAEIKSLAAQSLFLRGEERRAIDLRDNAPKPEYAESHDAIREAVHNYRVVDVRDWARATQLAYAMLRNKPYHYVEASAKDVPPKKILGMVDFCLAQYADRKNITASEWAHGEVLSA